jgi:hypothetical protein
MKMINLFLAGILLFATSCCKDEPEKEPTLKDKLIGKWIEVSPCENCNRTYTFSNNDTIYLKSKWDETIYPSFYQAISNDSILVIRNWEIEAKKKTTKHKVVFYSNDTVLINQFLPVDFGITGFEDITLAKSE